MKKEPGTFKLLGLRCCLPFYALWAVAATALGCIIGLASALLIKWGMRLSDKGISWPPVDKVHFR